MFINTSMIEKKLDNFVTFHRLVFGTVYKKSMCLHLSCDSLCCMRDITPAINTLIRLQFGILPFCQKSRFKLRFILATIHARCY